MVLSVLISFNLSPNKQAYHIELQNIKKTGIYFIW